MIETWSNNGVIVDLESSCNKDILILKVYDKLQDKCVSVSLTKNQLKDLAKFIDRMVELNEI